MVADINAMMSNLSNPDKDHRYMATSDLLAALQNPDWKQASYSDDSSQVCEKVVKQLDDSSGDISALAVKCLVALGHRVSPGHIGKMLELMCNKLIAPRSKKDHSDSTFIGLKAFLTDVPAVHGQLVATTTTPILGSGIKEQAESEAIAADCLDLLSTVFSRFGEHVKDRWNVTQTLLSVMAKGTHATSRKAVLCIPALAVHLDDGALADLMTELVGHVKAAATGAAAQTCMQAVAACAKALGFRFGPYIGTVLPMVTERCRAASANIDADSGLGVEEKEAALHATTALVQFCSEVVKPHVAEVTALALSEISFDPNLADGGDEEMDGGSGGDFDDYDDDFSDGDDYGDEEDMSWKVRRAACQLVVALVQAFPDLAPQLYGECRPVLLRRFSEREESVRLDVFAALSALVRQRGASAADGERAGLAADAEKDISALMKQLRNTRNAKLRGAVFGAVCALLEVASAAGVHGKEAVPMAQSTLEDSSSPNALKIEVLRFLRLAFCAEAAADLLPSLPPLVPVLKRSLEDRYYKVVSEAVAVVENTAVMAAAGGGGDAAVMRDLLQAVLGLLRAKDVDQEVKECSIRCVSTMLSLLPTSLGSATDAAMPLLCDKLQSDGTRYVAVVACGTVAGATPPLPLGQYVLPLITTMTPFLRKAHRGLRCATLAALAHVLASHSAGAGVPPDMLEALLQEAAELIADGDLLLAAAALRMCEASLQVAGGLAAMSAVTDRAVSLSCSALLSGAARDALKSFFRSTQQGAGILPHDTLRSRLLQAGTAAPRAAQRSAAECVAALSESSSDRVAETMRLCIQSLEQSSTAEAEQCLMLLLLGELGRVSDLSAFPEVERLVVGALSAGSEDVKATASLALGGVAVGNVHRYLPLLLSRASEVDRASPKQLYLLLKSLNEVLRTLLAKSIQMQPEQQEQVLQLLGSNMDAEEECRSVVADCLAQLAFMSPAALASWLLQQLSSDSAGARGVAVAAMKYALNDSAHDASHLTQHLPMFLQRLEDPDHNVRKEAVQLFNAAALTRPVLTAPCIAATLPLLLNLTIVDEKLVRVVELGPFKQKVDDGLSLRKHTLECVETLLSRPVYHDKLDMGPIAASVARTLGDDKAIKPVAHALLCRLCKLAPSAVLSHLESMITPLQKTLNEKLKDDAIPQERERHTEKIKSTLTAVKAIAEVPQATTMVPAFRTFLETKVLLNNDMAAVYNKLST